MVASLALHGAVAAAVGGHALARSTAVSAAPDVAELAAPPLETVEPQVTPQAPAAQPSDHAAHAHHHTHPYPVAPDHDAVPHDPSLVHAPFSPAPAPAPAPAVTAESAPLHFTMSVGPAAVALPASAAAAAHPADVLAADVETVLGDSAIDSPARSLSQPHPVYPAAAAAAGIEATIRVEILIDPSGVVLEARPLDHVGYGLEDAAARALRNTRFTPPRRHGRPVRVRLVWSYDFRLT